MSQQRNKTTKLKRKIMTTYSTKSEINKLTKEELVDLALKLDLDMSRKGIDTYFIVLEKLELIMGVDKFEVFQDKYLS